MHVDGSDEHAEGENSRLRSWCCSLPTLRFSSVGDDLRVVLEALEQQPPDDDPATSATVPLLSCFCSKNGCCSIQEDAYQAWRTENRLLGLYVVRLFICLVMGCGLWYRLIATPIYQSKVPVISGVCMGIVVVVGISIFVRIVPQDRIVVYCKEALSHMLVSRAALRLIFCR